VKKALESEHFGLTELAVAASLIFTAVTDPAAFLFLLLITFTSLLVLITGRWIEVMMKFKLVHMIEQQVFLKNSPWLSFKNIIQPLKHGALTKRN